jgi:flavin reductase (DIM6/NTAB) family NADH-FMN oxidoreductase RutF
MNLTPQKTDIIDSVLIKESPLSIECRVTQIIPLGSHDMFIAEVVNVLADEKYMDKESDAFLLGEAKLVAYNHGNYYKLGEKIGKFGWSVQKKK